RPDVGEKRRPPVSRRAVLLFGYVSHPNYIDQARPSTVTATEPGFKVDATELNAGVVAQKLRYLEVLLFQPWLVTIPADESGLGEAVIDLRVPNPVSFIIQKLLIRDERRQQKRLANDVVYIHDALQIFYGAIDTDLVAIWKELEGTLHRNQQQSVRDGVRELFSEMNDVIREAVTIPTDRRVDPDNMLRLCREGFEELFGEA
ncbi:GSU2403 family nucleotidyltransferase fold protein, partial [Paraburkholderia azotifigens]|uniref:GSU2403 family nucleotidyltransferase fold protein n=1 Tax=Paraburkholderia azotifigens TaxID=2057004 RepID=UPI00317A8815